MHICPHIHFHRWQWSFGPLRRPERCHTTGPDRDFLRVPCVDMERSRICCSDRDCPIAPWTENKGSITPSEDEGLPCYHWVGGITFVGALSHTEINVDL